MAKLIHKHKFSWGIIHKNNPKKADKVIRCIICNKSLDNVIAQLLRKK